MGVSLNVKVFVSIIIKKRGFGDKGAYSQAFDFLYPILKTLIPQSGY